jgi:hypothetical protein
LPRSIWGSTESSATTVIFCVSRFASTDVTPSHLLRMRVHAPEQPPQGIVASKTTVWGIAARRRRGGRVGNVG